MISASIDDGALSALDELLAAELARPGNIDSNQLVHLLSKNELETGPLSALGTSPTSSDLAERIEILRLTYPAIKAYKGRLNISASLLPQAFQLYIPIARFMATRARQIRREHGRAAVFGINGGQGSGKTTINALLQIILSQGLGCRAAGFSIDDVYKTYDERQTMAKDVHPLFAIRSVAGTHDTGLAFDTLHQLTHATASSRIPLPSFDKMAKNGEGDRRPESEWPIVEGPLDVVVFEGWCVGARPQPEHELAVPINERERDEDPDRLWRDTMNRLLAGDYRRLFDLIDDLFVMQIRSMEDVYRNRELQEQHLRRRLEEARRQGDNIGESGAMTPAQVKAFIGLYERTTRHMLQTLPDEATLTLFLGDGHRIERLQVRAPQVLADPTH